MHDAIILEVVNRFFFDEDISSIMHTGSSVTGDSDSVSDIDILLLIGNASRQTTSEIEFKGQHYHFIIFPREKFLDLVCEDLFKERFVFFSMLMQGRIIIDRDYLLQSIIKALRGQQHSLSEHKKIELIHTIKDELAYLIKSPESVGVALSAFVHTQQLIISILSPATKYIDRAMKAFPFYKRRMDDYLAYYIRNNDANTFADSLLAIVNTFSALPCQKSSSSILLSMDIEDRIMIFVPNERIGSPKVNYILHCLYKNALSTEIFAYYVSNYNIQQRGTYISLKNIGECSTKGLSRLVNNIIHDCPLDKFYIKLPYNTIFYCLNIWGSDEVRDEVYEILTECTAYMALGQPSNSECVLKGTAMGIIIVHSLHTFMDYESMHDLKQHLFLRYAADAITTGDQLSFHETYNKYSRLIANLHSYYSSNKQFISELTSNPTEFLDVNISLVERIISFIRKCYICSGYLPYNSIMFKNPKTSLVFNILDYTLSSFSLDSNQKLLVYYCGSLE